MVCGVERKVGDIKSKVCMSGQGIDSKVNQFLFEMRMCRQHDARTTGLPVEGLGRCEAENGLKDAWNGGRRKHKNKSDSRRRAEAHGHVKDHRSNIRQRLQRSNMSFTASTASTCSAQDAWSHGSAWDDWHRMCANPRFRITKRRPAI